MDKLRQLSPKKRLPHSIQIPPFPNKQDKHPVVSSQTTRVAVELSKFPPTFTKSDIHAMFHGYRIENDVAVGNVPRFLYPLRATVFFADLNEAINAVRCLHGKLVGTRHVEVKLIDSQKEKGREKEVKRLAEELKSCIIKVAQENDPHLKTAIVEIREFQKGNTNYAFLQSRAPITPDKSQGRQHAFLARNITKWQLVAGGAADLDLAKLKQDPEYDVRIEALEDLWKVVEGFAVTLGVWKEWEGSWMVDLGMVRGQEGNEVKCGWRGWG
ncbi:hypothetical protein DM02DRAFT_526049 [Periconia macrospinosa]|uniref:RRM domain-containing protein n=1 Tax=Periconia macrospinosa TaxID=97972 RepID=A0A2V1DS02_9PLEO|nr:hypothetical protein DM02DRAFT_526049 [Periconia macrospinosa]